MNQKDATQGMAVDIEDGKLHTIFVVMYDDGASAVHRKVYDLPQLFSGVLQSMIVFPNGKHIDQFLSPEETQDPMPEPPGVILFYSLYIHLPDKSWQYRCYATRTEKQIWEIAKQIMEADPSVQNIEITQVETGDET